jgi:5,10-methenyltetrahydromethanopterin hydrogenase
MKNKFRIEAEVVKGECPTCSQITTLVGISLLSFLDVWSVVQI